MVIRGTPGSPRPQKGDMRIGYAQGPKTITTPVALTVNNPQKFDILIDRTVPADGEVKNIALMVSMQGSGIMQVSTIEPTTGVATSLDVPFSGGITEAKKTLSVKKFDVVRVTLKELLEVEGQPSVVNSIGISFDLVTQQR